MKKLLILGGSILELEIVEHAKALGYYTVIADNHEDWNLSPAKKQADEGWNVSWSDIDALEKKCRERGVDGVLAGFSEFRVENMITLCDRLHIPCSLTKHQLDVTRDKLLFKKTCRTYDIPTIPEHRIEDLEIEFPVIVKPVDRAGSIGINVAFSRDELEKYYGIALDLSPSKNVIIEDFITDGTKVDVYYFVKDNKATFLGSSDTVMCSGDNGGAKILQKAWPFKSKYENEYLAKTDGNVRNMLRGLGINNAYATMSMFYRNGQFYFFEAGFRLSGELSYHYYEAVTGKNYLDSMIRFSIGEADDTVFEDCINPVKHCIVLNFFGIDGMVAQIKGLSALKANKDIYSVQLYVEEGDVINNATNVYRKIAMVTIVAETVEKMTDAVRYTNTAFGIIDADGRSLIYERMHPTECEAYFDRS